jgi:thermostable 8-oxoguanine DNA glycosylase
VNPTRHRIGQTFAEELAACLLGGHGVTGELGNAAFERVKQEGLIRNLCDDASVFEKLLREPLQIGNRWMRYRFWKQKAGYLAAAFRHLQFADLPLDDAVELRNRLMALPGIGPKTASWTVRNWTSSDAVAILDIHIVRAGMLMNLYCQSERVEKHYLQMETKFVKLATKLAVPTSDLDALIWSMMRTTPRLVARLLDDLRLRTPVALPVRAKQARMQAT